MSSTQSNLQITYIPILHTFGSPLNPRKHFDEASIDELADSIAAEGVLQPILVRRAADNPQEFEVIAGERRLRACKRLHSRTSDVAPDLSVTIPAIICDRTDEEALEIMITENLQRKDIHPMEEAAGFAQLIRVKHMDVKELAARVGKSPSFVAQRLKLMDLIEPIQQHFFDGYLLVKDALVISQLKPEDQQDFYDDELKGIKEVADINDWTFDKYQLDLDDAPFDTSDASLLKGKPACHLCPFNTASALLFADSTTGAKCNDSKCFHAKADASFEMHLAQAVDDVTTVMITRSYQIDSDIKKCVPTIEGILTADMYDVLEKPQSLDRGYFEGDNETEEEDEADYQKHLEDHNKLIGLYEEKIASGSYIKAFNIGGSHKGSFDWIKIKKSGLKVLKESADKDVEGIAVNTDADIKAEIQRIRDREKRALELDDIKLWDQVKQLFKPIDTIQDFTDNNLTQIELTAAAYAIYNKLNSYTGHKYEQYICGEKPKSKRAQGDISLDDYFAIITQHGVNELLRVFFLDTLPPHAIYHHIDGDAAIMMKVAESYYPLATETLGMAQRDIAHRRAAKVASRITALEAQLKASKKEKAALAAVAKKGKGIKALIPETH